MKLTGGQRVAIDIITGSEISQQERDASERTRRDVNKRLSAFKFSFVDIQPGAELTFSRDETITATVVEDESDNKINFRGEITSLSASATAILAESGAGHKVAGTLYWKYQGELLAEMRRRKEKESEADD